MSMTKRYLESLPEEEQNKILGSIDPEEESEPIYELRPGLKRCAHKMRHTAKQCQLADGHVGRHAWEPGWVGRVAAIEAGVDPDYEASRAAWESEQR